MNTGGVSITTLSHSPAPSGGGAFLIPRKETTMKELLLAAAFVAAILGAAMHQFAPEAWAQLLHALGL